VSDEEAFQSAIDANPDDHTVRLVFADWFQERDDPRAEGYRALGVLRLAPRMFTVGVGYADAGQVGNDPPNRHCRLPGIWFCETDRGIGTSPAWRDFARRREAEDAAALAFSRLPAARRAELLGLPAAEAA